MSCSQKIPEVKPLADLPKRTVEPSEPRINSDSISLDSSRIKLEELERKINFFESDFLVINKSMISMAITKRISDSIGMRGSFYELTLKDSLSQTVLEFDSGEYTIDRFNNNFSKAISKFISVVIDKLYETGNSDNYELFIIGSADILGDDSFQRDFKEGYEYEKITLYEKCYDCSGDYLAIESIYSINEPIKNSDLPNLRAQFIKQIIVSIYGDKIKKPIILEGEVTEVVNSEDRNVRLLLFLKD